MGVFQEYVIQASLFSTHSNNVHCPYMPLHIPIGKYMPTWRASRAMMWIGNGRQTAANRVMISVKCKPFSVAL